jgi:hypothetical protein
MKTVMKFMVLTLSLVTTPLLASPLLGERALPPEAQRTLGTRIRAERAAHPEYFAAVAAIEGMRPEVVRVSRSQHPTAVRALRSMGANALYPMIDLLAFSSPPSTLNEESREVLEIAALQCLGELRDRRAAPVLRAAFEQAASPDVALAAAHALGSLGGDGEIALLSTAAQSVGPRRSAAIEGLGRSRRTDAVGVVLNLLETVRDTDVTVAAAHALADACSTWVQSSNREVSVRCSAALVRAFVRTTAPVREEVQIALLSVATQETLAHIQSARLGATAETLRRLVVLERMVRRNVH